MPLRNGGQATVPPKIIPEFQVATKIKHRRACSAVLVKQVGLLRDYVKAFYISYTVNWEKPCFHFWNQSQTVIIKEYEQSKDVHNYNCTCVVRAWHKTGCCGEYVDVRGRKDGRGIYHAQDRIECMQGFGKKAWKKEFSLEDKGVDGRIVPKWKEARCGVDFMWFWLRTSDHGNESSCEFLD